METTLFGLPVTTAAIITGAPALIMVFLIWWGMSYKSTEDDSRADGGNGK